MSRNDFTKNPIEFIDEIISDGDYRSYTISGTGENQTIFDTTRYDSVPTGYTKELDASTLNTFRVNMNNIIDGKIDFMEIDTEAVSGDDYEIIQALAALGWEDCIDDFEIDGENGGNTEGNA